MHSLVLMFMGHIKNNRILECNLIKGHACPILYAAWHEAGLLSRDQILSLRKVDSDIEGHPTPVSPITKRLTTVE